LSSGAAANQGMPARPVATLKPGPNPLAPRLELLHDSDLGADELRPAVGRPVLVGPPRQQKEHEILGHEEPDGC